VAPFAGLVTRRLLSAIAALAMFGVLAASMLPEFGKFHAVAVALPSPFVLAVALTPFANFMTCRLLSVFAPAAALGMLAASMFSEFGKFRSVAVATPSAARSRPIVGLLAMSTEVVAAFSIVSRIAFVARIATVVRQFVRSGLTALRQVPVNMGCKLRQCGSGNSSQKQQHVISHPTNSFA
jgi:hypothetical protein